MSNPSDAGWCFRNPQRLTALLLAGKEGVVDRRLSELPAKSIAFGAFTDTASALAAFGATTMRHAFDQLLQFLHQGIAAIFRFVQMIWTWSVDQIATLLAVPWQQWPLWKQLLLVLVLAGVVWALLQSARELFRAAERILSAFATLLGVLVHTLPSVVLAGLIALGGVWLMNHLGNTPLNLPVAYNPFSSNPNSPSAASGAGTAPASNTTGPATTPSSTPAPAPGQSSSTDR